MSLAALIKAQQTSNTPTCKTCLLLPTLDDTDRDDFAAAAAAGVQPAVIARALCDRFAELGREDRVGDGSVRTHIRERHGL